MGTSLAVQWLGLWVTNAGGKDLIPGVGTKTLCASGGVKKINKIAYFQTFLKKKKLVVVVDREERREMGFRCNWVI